MRAWLSKRTYSRFDAYILLIFAVLLGNGNTWLAFAFVVVGVALSEVAFKDPRADKSQRG